MHKIHLHKNVKAILLMLFISVILLTPMLIHRTAILGIDSYFQLNRVYEAAMQIKHQNFSFLNLYSFQQSGRIVNETYSPLAGYFFGFLLLIAGNWFKFEIISSLLIFFTAGISVYAALNKLKVSFKASIATGALYMTSISIYGYLLGGNWRALAMALVPLLVIPMVDFYYANWSLKAMLRTGIIVVAVTQMQLVTMILALPVLIVPFLFGFFRSNQKLKALLNGVLAAFTALILSLNIILPYLELAKNNTIVPPVAMQLDKVTMDLIVPKPDRLDLTVCGFVFYIAIAGLIMFWHKIAPITRMISIFGIIYIILGTSLLPWRSIGQHFINLQNFLQMPIRFTLIGIPLLFIGTVAMFIEVAQFEKRENLKEVVSFIAITLSLISAGSFLVTLNNRVKQYKDPNVSIVQGLNTIDENAVVGQYKGKQLHNVTDLQPLLHTHDVSGLITSVDRITPDYLPVPVADYSKVKFYGEYRQEVAEQRRHYQHVVKPNGVLELRWQGKQSGERTVPAVAYARTKVIFNQKKLDNDKLKVTPAGSLKLNQKQGQNVLKLQYVPAKATMLGVLVATFSWAIALIAIVVLAIRKRTQY